MIGLSQRTYNDKVLDRFNRVNSRKGFLPMSHGMSLSKKQGALTSDEQDKMIGILYASTIRSIIYAMICTRPDVTCALSMTSIYKPYPGNDHRTTIKYVKVT